MYWKEVSIIDRENRRQHILFDGTNLDFEITEEKMVLYNECKCPVLVNDSLWSRPFFVALGCMCRPRTLSSALITKWVTLPTLHSFLQLKVLLIDKTN